jgi:hypothetical protein
MFDPKLCTIVGLKVEQGHLATGYRIPGTGWVLYDATISEPYVWGYEHDDEGKEYGNVESLESALRNILQAENAGMGDNAGYRQISVAAIERIQRNVEAVKRAAERAAEVLR